MGNRLLRDTYDRLIRNEILVMRGRDKARYVDEIIPFFDWIEKHTSWCVVACAGCSRPCWGQENSYNFWCGRCQRKAEKLGIKLSRQLSFYGKIHPKAPPPNWKYAPKRKKPRGLDAPVSAERV